MARLEDITKGLKLTGPLFPTPITIVTAEWSGEDCLSLVYRDAQGQLHEQLIYRHQEESLQIAADRLDWRFDGDGHLLKLITEAQRIRWAHLFDPYLAVHTSLVLPLPHQITAVYDKMLPRQPLRFLLADDPGAGKTIMAGLLIRELMIRGDLSRCLIVCPGSLAEQWQEELADKFHLYFQFLNNSSVWNSNNSNPFQRTPLAIARLDKLARDEELQAQLKQSEWDLIVCDEAHKMSATFFGGEVKFTKRYRLGQLLGQITRHFLLMTATPHNGKEEDFQLFMALIDQDRFEGRFRDGVHEGDVSDLMRRVVKEQLLKFDSTPLFPERRAYTVPYELSPLERDLYDQVTAYVREQFNRAENLENNGRQRTVGFALTVLQRRLASSTEAIYQSLRRRRERLETRLQEAEQMARLAVWSETVPLPFGDDQEEVDEDDFTAEELEDLEGTVIDQATTARTIEELRLEIQVLRDLETLARRAREGDDRKWRELRGLLEEEKEMRDAQDNRRKLVIFTEHKDTLIYLAQQIRQLLGRAEAVVSIRGGMNQKERRAVEAAFRNDPAVQVLVATDAAGEGINLQKAHLMVNYDLPWNPNRLEQRFGRIHRIGQKEVCHLWNLVAAATREGDVYQTLLRKLEAERKTLKGAVFDVLGKAIDGTELRRLMIQAIRYGEQPEVQAQLHQALESALDHDRLQTLLEEHALARDAMDTTQVQQIRQQMEQIEARRLQPYFIAAFFKLAWQQLEGTLRPREGGRFEITHVPGVVRRHNPIIPLRYERICFEKEQIRVDGKSDAEFICPGHMLLDAVIDLLLGQYQRTLSQGSVLVDYNDPDEIPHLLFYLEHGIQDGRPGLDGRRRLISRRFQFVEMELLSQNSDHQYQPGRFHQAGPSPYLDYEPIEAEDLALVSRFVEQARSLPQLERQAFNYAVTRIAPGHLQEVKEEREPLIAKTYAAVKARLTKETVYWDGQAQKYREQARAGKINAQLNADQAQRRADELEARRDRRLVELEQERQIASLPPRVLGGALVIPGGLLARLKGQRTATWEQSVAERQRVEQLAMATVMAVERRLGYLPKDVGDQKLGYDVVSRDLRGHQRFIEVKGTTGDTVTVTRNEILVSLNAPERWLLALVKVPSAPDYPGRDVFAVRDERVVYETPSGCEVRYIRQPFTSLPDEEEVSRQFRVDKLWVRGVHPEE